MDQHAGGRHAGESPEERVTGAVLAGKDLGGRSRDAAALARFCAALLQRVAPAELAMTEPSEVAPEILAAFDLLTDRRPDGTSVRVGPLAASFFGPEGGRTVVEVAAPDRPLLFSTVLTALQGSGLEVRRFSHPILGVDRAEDGRVLSIGPPTGAATQEVLVHLEVAEPLDDEGRAAVTAAVERSLEDLVRAARDLDTVRERVAVAADRLEELGPLHYPAADCGEAAAFCRWLLDGNFLFVGLRHDPPDGTLGLGADDPEAVDLAPVDHDALAATPLAVRRSRRTSRISRPERLAELLLADLDDTGERTGAVHLLGLTSLRGRSERPSGTPWVRTKLRRVLAREQILSGSHDETVLRTIFDGLPWDLLLLADVDWMHDTLVALLDAQQTGGAAVRLLTEPESDALTVLIGVPQESFRTELSAEVQELLRRTLDVQALEVEAELSGSGLTMLSCVAGLEPGGLDRADVAALTARLRDLARSWSERLGEALAVRVGSDATHVARRWLPRLPAPYREATAPDVAADDVLALDEVDGTGDVRLRILPTVDDGGRHHLRLAVGGRPLELSGFVPVLESVGLVVAAEMAFDIDPAAHHPARGTGDGPASVMDLLVSRVPQAGGGVEIATGDADRLGAAILAAWRRDADVDRLNELVLAAGIDWEQVSVLRAYAGYLSQVVPGLRPGTVIDALADNPATARALWEWFTSRFDPHIPGGTDRPADGDPAVRERVVESCDGVARLDQDRVLRQLLALVDATVRTNVWAARRSPSVALKLDGGRLPGRAAGETWREVWVSAPGVEGVHLRAGPVARGGLRWSDREGDVRTEVLQLMQAQELKNALIVPTGAKGGFVLRHRPEDPADLPAAVRAGYTVFVDSLLDLTDDLVDGRPVHPAGVRRGDGDDPYLVVAADRGTASFSDLANSLATARDFWLGDAFASGGSDGYDHKALGVTARGAWVSVTEHFAGLGVDVATDPITVAGVGDMSGDVFGNGMLQSRAIRLVVAFDHRHVFIDPDPDPVRTFEERRRLFELPRSSWDDVDRAVLSRGAMIVPRTTKRVAPTPEAARALGLSEHDLDADGSLALPDLVRAVLRAPTDLLYFGGIGTYVKGRDETAGRVGDPANDEVRVDATDLRVRVVAEGANLGMTPRARVEFAAAGGLVNTDAIDNSAGVDSSDHEVNLKVLLSMPERTGEIDRATRNRLLADAADDVVARVLGNVARQNRGLTREERASRASIEPFLALLFALEADGAVDRDTHALPSGTEVRRRREQGLGLLRPELAVIMAAAKEQLAAEVLAGTLPDREPLAELLRAYFPEELAARFARWLPDHPLRREIVASRLANEVVDRMGMTWVPEACARSGATVETVLAAYWMARETARIGSWWTAIDDVARPERDLLWDPAAHVIDALAGDYLRRGVAAAWRWDEIERNAAAARVLARADRDGVVRDGHDDATRPDGDLSERADRLRRLALAPGLAQVSDRAGVDPAAAVGAYLEAGRRFGLDRLTWAVLGVELAPTDTWSRRHRETLLFDLDRLRRAAAAVLLATPGGAPTPELEDRLAGLAPRIDEAVDAAEAATGRLDPLAVVVAELWLLVEEAAGEIPRA